MTRSPSVLSRSSVVTVLLAAAAVALVAAASWWVWLGWDHSYYEVDGVAQGPYRAWQVVGCGATVVAATVLARVRARHWSGLLLLPVAAVLGFAWPWSADAAAADETGLWAVGLVMILFGGGIGLVVVTAVTDGVLQTRERAGNVGADRSAKG